MLLYTPHIHVLTNTSWVSVVDERLVQRSIRRLRRIDGALRALSKDSKLKTYANRLVVEYRQNDREDGRMALADVEANLTLHLKDVSDGLEVIRKEVGIIHELWKEGSAIRDRFMRMLSYVEDMRQWADKHKLLGHWHDRKLLFQQGAS